jgi:hypothetical protein
MKNERNCYLRIENDQLNENIYNKNDSFQSNIDKES